MFTDNNWNDLHVQGFAIVSNQIDQAKLVAAKQAADELNGMHPEGGWDPETAQTLWKQIGQCGHPSFKAIVNGILDTLALEILETAPAMNDVQLACAFPGFESNGGRKFHIDGGHEISLGVFNVLFGVALTDVPSPTFGGFHVLPASHHMFAGAFQTSPPLQHWGNCKRFWVRSFGHLLHTRMVVPSLTAGDIIVAHSFLAHGTSSNTSDIRRDMIFQRRSAAPLLNADTQERAREVFMRDCWAFFRRRPQQFTIQDATTP